MKGQNGENSVKFQKCSIPKLQCPELNSLNVYTPHDMHYQSCINIKDPLNKQIKHSGFKVHTDIFTQTSTFSTSSKNVIAQF